MLPSSGKSFADAHFDIQIFANESAPVYLCTWDEETPCLLLWVLP